jgi:hypothetical protein
MIAEGFSVKRKGGTVTIIAHAHNGTQTEVNFWAGDVPDLAGLLLEAEREFQMEEAAGEAAYEAGLPGWGEQEAEAKETRLEMQYHNEHPFE